MILINIVVSLTELIEYAMNGRRRKMINSGSEEDDSKFILF